MIIQQPNGPPPKRPFPNPTLPTGDQNSTTFRIRTLSNSKQKRKVQTASQNKRKQKQKKTVTSVQRVRTQKNETRSTSLKFIVRQRYETKKSQVSSDEEEQLHIVEVDQYTVNTEPAYINQKQQRSRQRQRQIQKLFNPKTIMKLFKTKKPQNSQIQNKSENPGTNSNATMKKQKMKSQFRMNKFVIETNEKKKTSQNQPNQSKFNNQEYWKKVNESLILAGVQDNDEVSKDLKELCNKL